MNDIVATQSQLPAHLQGVVGQEVFEEFSGGVQSGFPVISYRGKVWRVRKSGEEVMHVDVDGNALPTIEVVLLKSNERPSKTCYDSGYTEGDQAKPACWSSDGIRPDSGVPVKKSAMCGPCPANVWGSKMTDQGKPSRQCQDVRRCAVAFLHQLEEVTSGARAAEDVDILLLRVPPASLNPLKDYAETVLKPKGIPPYVLSTKIGFDADVAYPRFTFKGSRFLNEQEFAVSSALRSSDEAKRVLNESQEHVEEGTTGGPSEATGAGQPTVEATTPAPAPALTPKTKAKPVPVAEDEPPRAADIEAAAAQAEEVDDIAAAPPPSSTSTADPNPAPAPAAPATQPPQTADFEDMLDSILG